MPPWTSTTTAIHRSRGKLASGRYKDIRLQHECRGMHTEEFYHGGCNTERLAGYSAPTAIAFRKWLRKKYKDSSALRQAWGRDGVDFDNAYVPTRQERLDMGDGTFRDAQHRNVVDFYLFWNELVQKTIDCFAQIAKEACDGQNVVGAFYGYMYEFAGDPEFGHNALLNCFQVTAAQRHVIKQNLKRDGKHLLWCSAAGWFSEAARSAEICRELTGFELVRSDNDSSPVSLRAESARKRLGSPGHVSEVGVRENRGWTG